MKKNIFFIGASICLLVLLGIGLSYSMWNMSISQNTNNVIATTNECFDITLTNQSNTINLENAYPISDTKGKTLIPFTFTIKNTCQMAASYSVNLESLKGSTLSSRFIKVMVNDNNPKMLNSLESTDTVNTGSIESRVLDTGTIFKNKTKEYSIRLWIDYDTTLEDLNNEIKVLKSKIIVKGVPSNEEEPLELLTDHITALSTTDTTNIATDDPNNNIRYIGANPNNYVYFNCSDYSNQTADTCEKWRIIGLFNNITKGDGTKENLIKIARNESLGIFEWDHKASNVGSSIYNGSNDWSDSQLMMMLNPTDYLKSGFTNSNDKIFDSNNQEIYSKIGSYYNGSKGCSPTSISKGETFNCIETDFTVSGLKNNVTRSAIQDVAWNVGGIPLEEISSTSDPLAKEFYNYERGTSVYTGRPTTWTGKIGLMYPSDYGYATSGGTTKDRTACLAKELYSWSSSEFSDCKENDYLYNSEYSQWTLTPAFSQLESTARAGTPGIRLSSAVFYIDTTGTVFNKYAYEDNNSVHPTLYLKSLFTIKDGDGSENSPYQLNIE